ncbi:MAG: citrate transporter [Deltaproteobacteria bacterium CG07_land_8_20_14_0_80_60_11]|nr:MAG: citrate transporter [Deltaproteobacteria bacterium CG07_land_8_20_14_0_80_60_11]
MRHRMVSFLNILIFLLIAGLLAASAVMAAPAPAGDHLAISGLVTNPMGKGLKEVEVEVLVNGQPVKPTGKEAEIATGKPGGFVADFILPAGTLPAAKVEVKAGKPSWKPVLATPVKVVEAGMDAQGNKLFQAAQNLTLNRTITPGFWIASLILLLVYVVISLELMHRTLVSFLGAALIIFITYTLGTWDKSFYIISFDDAIGAIDLNVIFLLMGMMLFVGVMKKTGMFQFLAFKAYALAKGNVFVLSLILQVITAVVSAFLDNVTTMLLVLPVTIEIAVTLKINPLVLLIPEVFASNVGGTATLIGDPPNILIGSYAGLTFGQFVRNLTLVCTVCLAVSSFFFLWWHKRDYYLKAEVKDIPRTIAYLKEEYQITDKKLMIQSLMLLGFTILLFALHGFLHMPVSIAALVGSLLLVAISGEDIVELLEKEVEWPTLVFFIGLFMVIAGAEETGLIQIIANFVKDVSRGNLTAAIIIVLWVSAIASAFIDNIPFTATMLPIIAFLNQTIPGAESGVLWWSLSLGACLGGNGTMIGASANVVTVGLADKAGYHISFLEYMKACWWPMMITVTICMVYLLIAY